MFFQIRNLLEIVFIVIFPLSKLFKVHLLIGVRGVWVKCWGGRVTARVLFLFYVNVSEMRPRFRLSFQLLTIPAPWVLLPHRVVYPLGSTLGDCLSPVSLRGSQDELKPTTFSSLLLFCVFPLFLTLQRYSTLSAACWGYSLIIIIF